MCWMLLWKYILKHLAAYTDLVLNDINYPRASTGYLAMQYLLKWPMRSEVAILSWEIAHAFSTPKSHEWSHIKSQVEENNMQSKVLLLEQREVVMWDWILQVLQAGTLKPKHWWLWAAFMFSVQIKSGKHKCATKSRQLKRESCRVILVMLYLFWRLPWKHGG